MSLPLCPPEHCLLESELRQAVQHQTLQLITILETDEGFYVQVQLTWGTDTHWSFTTRRLPQSPRLFRNLTRLHEHLRHIAPTIPIHLLRMSG